MRGFNLLQIGLQFGGPFIDVVSFEDKKGMFHSLLCMNFTLFPFQVYIEIFFLVLVDTYEDEDENKEDAMIPKN